MMNHRLNMMIRQHPRLLLGLIAILGAGWINPPLSVAAQVDDPARLKRNS